MAHPGATNLRMRAGQFQLEASTVSNGEGPVPDGSAGFTLRKEASPGAVRGPLAKWMIYEPGSMFSFRNPEPRRYVFLSDFVDGEIYQDGETPNAIVLIDQSGRPPLVVPGKHETSQDVVDGED